MRIVKQLICIGIVFFTFNFETLAFDHNQANKAQLSQRILKGINTSLLKTNIPKKRYAATKYGEKYKKRGYKVAKSKNILGIDPNESLYSLIQVKEKNKKEQIVDDSQDNVDVDTKNNIHGKISNRDLYQGEVEMNSLDSLTEQRGFEKKLELRGPIDQGKLIKLIDKYKPKFTYCYKRSLFNDSNRLSSLALSWRLVNGKPKSIKVVKSRLSSRKLHRCVMRVVKNIDFSELRDGKVVYPFHFSNSYL
jgi:hypothetical protein